LSALNVFAHIKKFQAATHLFHLPASGKCFFGSNRKDMARVA